MSDMSRSDDWEVAKRTLHKSLERCDVADLTKTYESFLSSNMIGRMWSMFYADPSFAAQKIEERNYDEYTRQDFCITMLCLGELDKVKQQTVPPNLRTAESLKQQLDQYFTAQFRGVGPGASVFSYYDSLIKKLLISRSSAKECAMIAWMIYDKKNRIMTKSAPRDFAKWHKALCQITGWPYNKDYKPNALKSATPELMDEFCFLNSV